MEISKNLYSISAVIDKTGEIEKHEYIRMHSFVNNITINIPDTSSINTGDHITIITDGFSIPYSNVKSNGVTIGNIQYVSMEYNGASLSLSHSDRSHSSYNPLFESVDIKYPFIHNAVHKLVFTNIPTDTLTISMDFSIRSQTAIISRQTTGTYKICDAENSVIASKDFALEFNLPKSPTNPFMYVDGLDIEKEIENSSFAMYISTVKPSPIGTRFRFEFNDPAMNNVKNTIATNPISFGSSYLQGDIAENGIYRATIKSVNYEVVENTPDVLEIRLLEETSIPFVSIGRHYCHPKIYNETTANPITGVLINPIKYKYKIFSPSGEMISEVNKTVHSLTDDFNASSFGDYTLYTLSYRYSGDVPDNTQSPNSVRLRFNKDIEFPEIPVVRKNNKIYTLNWDKSITKMPKGDHVVEGVWSSVNERSYGVTYRFNSDRPLPESIVVPNPITGKYPGDVIQSPSVVSPVVTSTGKFTFNGWDKNSVTINSSDEVVTGTWTYANTVIPEPTGELSKESALFIRTTNNEEVSEWFGIGSIKDHSYLNIPGVYNVSSNDSHSYFGSDNPSHRLWQNIISRQISVAGDKDETYVTYTIANDIGLSMSYHNVVIRSERERLIGSTSKPYRLKYTKWIPGYYVGNDEYPYGPDSKDSVTKDLLERVKTLENTLDHIISNLMDSGLWDVNNGLISDPNTTGDSNSEHRENLKGGFKPGFNIAYGNINLFGQVPDGPHFIRTNDSQTEDDLVGGI